MLNHESLVPPQLLVADAAASSSTPATTFGCEIHPAKVASAHRPSSIS